MPASSRILFIPIFVFFERRIFPGDARLMAVVVVFQNWHDGLTVVSVLGGGEHEGQHDRKDGEEGENGIVGSCAPVEPNVDESHHVKSPWRQ